VTQQAFDFMCAGETLVGIVTQSNQPYSTGVLVVVGGPQYRIGSHRQFLLLARVLADAGYPTLRFDCRGMGDSTGGQHNFEQIGGDIGAAIDAFFSHTPGLTRIVLWGLCDAASASLLYWNETHDERVAGLCLLNPWVRSEATLAKTYVKHYYGQRLLQPEFWAKLFSGKLGVGKAIGGFLKNVQQSGEGRAKTMARSDLGYQQKMAQALADFSGPVLLILSGDDYTAKEFVEATTKDSVWRRALAKSTLTRMDIEHADHTFSASQSRLAVENICKEWLGEFSMLSSAERCLDV
jgi:uncharacterized protein